MSATGSPQVRNVKRMARHRRPDAAPPGPHGRGDLRGRRVPPCSRIPRRVHRDDSGAADDRGNRRGGGLVRRVGVDRGDGDRIPRARRRGGPRCEPRVRVVHDAVRRVTSSAARGGGGRRIPMRTAGLTVLSRLQPSTFAHLSPVPAFILAAPSDVRAKRGDHGPGERHALGRRPKLARRLHVVRMPARIRCIRRRRLTITAHPSH